RRRGGRGRADARGLRHLGSHAHRAVGSDHHEAAEPRRDAGRAFVLRRAARRGVGRHLAAGAFVWPKAAESLITPTPDFGQTDKRRFTRTASHPRETERHVEAIGHILPIALAVAISSVPIMVTIYILLSSNRAR